MKLTKWILIAAALLVLLIIPINTGVTPATAQITYTNCFPSCDPTDAKMAAITSGSAYSTLVLEPLYFFIRTTKPQLNLGIFDPDTSGFGITLGPPLATWLSGCTRIHCTPEIRARPWGSSVSGSART